jgi:hypothetical protein
MKRVNHVWTTDIKYIRMAQRFLYLVAIDGLVQPVRAEVVAVSEDGCGDPRGGAEVGAAAGRFSAIIVPTHS